MDNQQMMKKLQKSMMINRICNLVVAFLLICVLVGGYVIVQKFMPALSMLDEARASLKKLEQIDYEALNQAIEELDVKALNEKIEQLDVAAMNEALSKLDIEALNAKIEALDIESINEALEGLDTEEITEALENLNEAADKLEAIGEGMSSITGWFRK